MSYQVIEESWKDGLLESKKIHDFQNREDAGKYILSEKSEIDLSLYEVSEDCDDEDRSQGLELFYCSNEANGYEWAYYYYLKELPDRILCTAVHLRSPATSESLPINIESGLVIAGRRHSDCFAVAIAANFDCDGYVDGFITASNRFVDRVEAFEIAKNAGQLLSHVDRDDKLLISEDLYFD